MSKALLPLLLSLLVSGSECGAQEFQDVCRVSLAELTSEAARDVDSFKLQELLTFQPELGEEQRTTKSVRLPGSKLFVVASVFYTDESMSVENKPDNPIRINDVSVSLELLISRTGKRNPFESLQHAESEVMVTEPNAARVSTIVKTAGRTLLVVMEYRRSIKVN